MTPSDNPGSQECGCCGGDFGSCPCLWRVIDTKSHFCRCLVHDKDSYLPPGISVRVNQVLDPAVIEAARKREGTPPTDNLPQTGSEGRHGH